MLINHNVNSELPSVHSGGDLRLPRLGLGVVAEVDPCRQESSAEAVIAVTSNSRLFIMQFTRRR